VHNFLRDRDVVVSEIQDYPWGRFCFFSDPDGAVGQSTARCVRSSRATHPDANFRNRVSVDDALADKSDRSDAEGLCVQGIVIRAGHRNSEMLLNALHSSE
jgi:hypothetical protein